MAGTLAAGAVPFVLLAAGSSGFAPTRREAPSTDGPLVSVNAGDPGLYLGGGTINLAFAGEVDEPSAFAALHARALMLARMGKPWLTQFATGAPVRLILTKRGPGDGASGQAAAGTVFLDIFADASLPHGGNGNRAMAYLVPPKGGDYPDEASFLAAVDAAAGNLVAVVAQFNAGVGAAAPECAGLPALTYLRLCLFSGGQFRRAGTTPDQVAQRIFAGIDRALSAASPAGAGLKQVEFESGRGEFLSISGR